MMSLQALPTYEITFQVKITGSEERTLRQEVWCLNGMRQRKVSATQTGPQHSLTIPMLTSA